MDEEKRFIAITPDDTFGKVFEAEADAVAYIRSRGGKLLSIESGTDYNPCKEHGETWATLQVRCQAWANGQHSHWRTLVQEG